MITFVDFLNEKYGQFDGSIKYTNWNDFGNQLKKTIEIGFKNEKELIELMNMDFDKYSKIKENMIFNWKDSVTKSLLHFSVGQNLPKEGTDIFKDSKQQTLFLVLASNGSKTRNIFGYDNELLGLRMISFLSLSRIKNIDPNDSFPLYTVKSEESVKIINNILQYIWIYTFYHHYIMKKQNIKLPKYLYRGIRVFHLNGNIIKELRLKSNGNKNFIDLLIDYIIQNGISKISDGKLLSFTESWDIANYFANGEGIILRVDPTKVEIVTSIKTEEFFQMTDFVSKKNEKEYIIKIPNNYKFTKDDIEIVNKDYFISINSPLSVQFFDHDDIIANYILDDIEIEVQYIWKNNTNGGINFRNLSSDDWWGYSRKKFKKEFNVDPMPTKVNLNRIKNFTISKVKKW